MQNDDESVEIKNSILASNELESSLPQTSTGRPRRSKLKCSHEGCTFEVGHRLLMERHVFEAHDDENSDIDVDSPPEEEIPKRKRKHLCPKNGCNKRFVSLSHFRRHESVHDKEGPTFQCHVSDCTETFSDNSSLDRHQQNAHHDEGTHICTEVGCSERFWFASALKQHQLQHDDHTVKKIITKKFVCEIPGCAMRFETMANLRRHQKYHDRFDKQRNEKTHKCTLDGCWRSFYTFSHLQRHQKSHDLPPKEYILEKGIHICKQCNRSFPRAAHLRRHELIHENYKFVCKHKGCTMRYADAERLKRHQKLNHDEVAREAVLRHACTQKGCTWTFSCASHLQRHLLTHEKSARPTAGSRTIPEEKYAPESVDSEDSEDSMENLKIESILSKEESDSELLDDEDAVEKVSRKDYICSEEGCTAIYRTAYHFRRHIEEHEAASHLDPLEEITQIFIEYSQPLDQPEEPEKPAITTKNVTRFSDSSEHTEVSEMVANEQHQVVHKNSSKKSVLKNHICLECSKGFSKPSLLLRHQKVHDGRARQRQCVPKSQKSKICLECSKEFSSNKSLLRHQVVHDSHARQIALDRNVCLIDGCNKRYTQAEALRKHHQVKHTAGFKRNSNQVNQLFTCPECSKAFPSLNRLLLHKVVHDSTDRQIASNRNVCKLDGCNKRFSDASHLRQHELTHTKNAQRISRNVPTLQTIQLDTSSRDTDDGDIDPLNIVKLEQIKMETSSIDEVTIDDKSDVFKILPYDEACRLLQQWEVNSKQPTDVNSHVDGTE